MVVTCCFAPQMGSTCRCGEYSGFFGVGCWYFCNTLSIYPGMEISTYPYL